jgi:hypothetical protein
VRSAPRPLPSDANESLWSATRPLSSDANESLRSATRPLPSDAKQTVRSATRPLPFDRPLRAPRRAAAPHFRYSCPSSFRGSPVNLAATIGP